MPAEPSKNLLLQHIADLELRINELQKFEAIFHSTNDGRALTDLDGKILEVNATFCAILGYTRDELLRMRIIDLKPPALHKALRQRFNSLKERGDILMETLWLHKSGNPIPCELSASIVQLENKPIVQAVIREIGKRKQTAQSMNERHKLMLRLLNAHPDIICLKNGQGQWLLANTACLRLFQLEDIDYTGKTDLQLAEESAFYRKAFMSCQESDEIAWQRKMLSHGRETVLQPNSEINTYDVIKVPLFHPDGRRKGLVVIGRDITENIRASEDLQQKNKQIHDTNIALQVLLDQHKGNREQLEQEVLVNLQRGVFPHIELLRRTLSDEEGQEHISVIVNHLHSLTKSFFRKLDALDIGLTPKEQLVADLVKQGKSSPVIAQLLGLTTRTIEVYRNNIRKKLNIGGKKISLHKYLNEKF